MTTTRDPKLNQPSYAYTQGEVAQVQRQRPARIVREASDLGWAVGELPKQVVIDGLTFHYSTISRYIKGDVISWQYVANDGTVLVVLND